MEEIKDYENKIFLQDSRNMYHLPDNSIDIMITSPPYNVTKQYDQNLTLKEYLKLISDVQNEVYRVLKPDGILALNVANIGRKPYIPLDCYFIEILEKIGFDVINEIIWEKSIGSGGNCAWGSWKSSSNPSLRDVHEYIIIAKMKENSNSIIKLHPKKLDTFPDKIDEKKFEVNVEDFFSDIWSFGTESAKKVNHPAPFRVELPYRIIQMFSNDDSTVLDPFMGSGSTAIAALISNRKYVGYEIDEQYYEISMKRLKIFEEKFFPLS